MFDLLTASTTTLEHVTLAVRLVSDPDEIRALLHSGLSFRDNSAEPAFFLGSLARNWLPLVAVVSRSGGEIAGLVYLRERLFAGMPSGIIHGDHTFDTMVIAAEQGRDEVLETALRELLAQRRIRGVRLVVDPGSDADRVARRVAAEQQFDVTPSGVESYHVRLPLADTYAAFLETLGSRTRRNFRHYRRDFEAGGHQYLDRLTLAQYREAAAQLRDQCSITASAEALELTLRWTEATARPWMVGLRHKSGEWLGVSGGCLLPGRAMMFLQLNHDRLYGGMSLSTVLRGYLVESLIGWECRELGFWLGAAGALARYAQPYPSRRLYLDRRSWPWRVARWGARKLAPRVRPAQRHDLSWIAPIAAADVTTLPE